MRLILPLFLLLAALVISVSTAYSRPGVTLPKNGAYDLTKGLACRVGRSVYALTKTDPATARAGVTINHVFVAQKMMAWWPGSPDGKEGHQLGSSLAMFNDPVTSQIHDALGINAKENAVTHFEYGCNMCKTEVRELSPAEAATVLVEDLRFTRKQKYPVKHDPTKNPRTFIRTSDNYFSYRIFLTEGLCLKTETEVAQRCAHEEMLCYDNGANRPMPCCCDAFNGCNTYGSGANMYYDEYLVKNLDENQVSALTPHVYRYKRKTDNSMLKTGILAGASVYSLVLLGTSIWMVVGMVRYRNKMEKNYLADKKKVEDKEKKKKEGGTGTTGSDTNASQMSQVSQAGTTNGGETNGASQMSKAE